MAKTKISEFNANPALNTDIDSINIAEGCAPSGINDAIRELMSQLKDWQAGTSNDPMVIGSSGSLTLNQGTANGVAYLNGSKVVTSGSALTFDGTTLSLGTGGSIRLPSGYEVGFGATNTTYWIGDSTNNWHRWFTSSSEQMRLTSTGLGIGTSSPTDTLGYGRALDIQGTLGSALYARSATNSSSVYGVFAYDTNAVRVNVGAVGTNNYLRFVTAVGEAARIDSSGNLGLGVTPSAWGSAWKAMQISTFASFGGNNDDKLTAIGNNYYNDGSAKYIGTGQAALYSQYQGAHRWSTAASGTAGNAITFTQAMTLTASSELLVNRTSASGLGKLNVEGGADFTAGNVYMCRDSGNVLVGTTSSAGSFRFQVVNTNSSGNAVWLQNASGNDRAILVLKHDQAAGATSGAMVGFQNSAGTTVGTITSSNTATAYNTSSDYRLKNSIAPMTGALAKVALLKPCTYKWNADGSDGEGFIAHELAEVCPNAVTGDKDAVDEEGNPKYQGIDVSFLVATLTAAIQELKAEFDAYKASHP